MRNQRFAPLWIAIVILPALLAQTHVNDHLPADGEYIGFEKMPNQLADDPGGKNTKWFHENTLFIRGNQAILDKSPVYFEHGKKFFSSSDGGFLTFRGEFRLENGHSVVALRLFDSDYVAFRVGQVPYSE